MNKLPPDYIDDNIVGRDKEILETFYTACLEEGGTADEVHLRGLYAVINRYGNTSFPVAVDDREPNQEDCNDDGYFWVGTEDDQKWELMHIGEMNWEYRHHHGYTHWTNYWAISLPA